MIEICGSPTLITARPQKPTGRIGPGTLTPPNPNPNGTLTPSTLLTIPSPLPPPNHTLTPSTLLTMPSPLPPSYPCAWCIQPEHAPLVALTGVIRWIGAALLLLGTVPLDMMALSLLPLVLLPCPEPAAAGAAPSHSACCRCCSPALSLLLVHC